MDRRTIERAILGYMITDNSLDSHLLSEKEFSSERNQLIYRAIRELKKNGEIIEPVTLAGLVGSKVELTYIVSLDDGLPLGRLTEAYFKNHVNQLILANKEHEIKELLSKAGTEPNLIPQIEKILKDYTLEMIEPIEGFTLASYADELQDFIRRKRAGELWGLRTKSFPRLDKALMGIREIIVLVANPKTGKSTLALQIASEIADEGAGVIYYDFENGRMNLMTRDLCRKYNIKYKDELFNNEFSEQQIEEITKTLKNQDNFAIITDRKLSVEKIRSQVFQMRKHTGQEHILIVVDSLQKLPMKDLRERRAAVDQWLRDFEELKAEDPYLTILLISELSRAGQPKESGDIEYTGHFLLKLKKNQEEEDIDRYGDDMVRILTLEYARDVQSGISIKYKTDFDYWKFEEPSESEEAF